MDFLNYIYPKKFSYTKNAPTWQEYTLRGTGLIRLGFEIIKPIQVVKWKVKLLAVHYFRLASASRLKTVTRCMASIQAAASAAARRSSSLIIDDALTTRGIQKGRVR
jgi:hypothetical protein